MLTDERTWQALRRANPVPHPGRLLSDAEMAVRFASVSERQDAIGASARESRPIAHRPRPLLSRSYATDS